MRLIVGLGNPETQYDNTNHNIGFDVVTRVAEELGVKFKTKECLSLVAQAFCQGEKVVFAKPQTYMNNSGDAVRQLVRKYGVDPRTELLIVCDDFDILEGTIRFRESTSHTTHNGIKSIISVVGKDFLKLKVSIGKKPEFMPTADFVLAKIRNEKTYEARDKAVSAVLDFFKGEPLNVLMQKYHNL